MDKTIAKVICKKFSFIIMNANIQYNISIQDKFIVILNCFNLVRRFLSNIIQ